MEGETTGTVNLVIPVNKNVIVSLNSSRGHPGPSDRFQARSYQEATPRARRDVPVRLNRFDYRGVINFEFF